MHRAFISILVVHRRLTHIIAEFKEIRKEWKAKKKEEDHARKQEEDRMRAEGRPVDGPPTNGTAQYAPAHMIAQSMGGPQLPPIGYAPAPGQGPPQYAAGQGQVDGQAYQAQGQIYANGGYPASPYGPPGQQMYQQRA